MLEDQRYGRNKDTIVNKSYIESGEYRKKFDSMTNNPDVNRILYQKAKEMLFHRSGTLFEDMVWVDGKSGAVVASVTDSDKPQVLRYNDNIQRKLRNTKNIVAMHTHPHSLPPSAADFNSFLRNSYEKAFVLCHDGKIFEYSSNRQIESSIIDAYASDYMREGNPEYEALILALSKLGNFIKCREVK